ncbi:hypothetical protein ACLB2K_013825 [Fragaria x ananassa]
MNNLESSVATWKRLPEEPVVFILDKLLESIDYVHFAAVCKEWYRLAKDNYPPMLLLPPSATPFLGRPRLFSFSQQRTYNNFRLQVPSPRVGNIFCCGCGHGWLAKVDVYDDGHRRSELVWRIELVNPFRQATTTLTLPPLAFERGFSSRMDFDDCGGLRNMYNERIGVELLSLRRSRRRRGRAAFAVKVDSPSSSRQIRSQR